MLIFTRLRKLFLKHLSDLRWHSVLLAVAFFMVSSWLLLWLSGEQALVASVSDYVYWIAVTGSTVGYGDMSPTTAAGKLVVSFYVIPMGLGIFSMLVGRVAVLFVNLWRRSIRGQGKLAYSNHYLVIGWNEGHSMQLLRLLLRDIERSGSDKDLALVVRADIENPMPHDIGFIKANNFCNDADMKERANVDQASTIIIDNPDDDVTMTTALYCADKNPNAHIIAYFNDDKLSKLLQLHCPNVQCIPSVTVEMIAKAATDRGTVRLHHELLNDAEGMTQYRVPYPNEATITVRDLFQGMKEKHNATLLCISPDDGKTINVNPTLDECVRQGDMLYYVADERINSMEWEAFRVQ